VIKLTNNYCGISLLTTSYKMLLNILLSMLSPYIDEIQCELPHNRSNTKYMLLSSYRSVGQSKETV
jgi:hypothetical protein